MIDSSFDKAMRKIGLNPNKETDVYIVGGGGSIFCCLCYCCFFQYLAIKMKKNLIDEEKKANLRELALA